MAGLAQFGHESSHLRLLVQRFSQVINPDGSCFCCFCCLCFAVVLFNQAEHETQQHTARQKLRRSNWERVSESVHKFRNRHEVDVLFSGVVVLCRPGDAAMTTTNSLSLRA